MLTLFYNSSLKKKLMAITLFTCGVVLCIFLVNRIPFEVNVDAAERAGLKINSQLLKLAKIVKEGSR